jgi:hypothetical protein
MEVRLKIHLPMHSKADGLLASRSYTSIRARGDDFFQIILRYRNYSRNRTRTRTNTNPDGTKASAAGRSVRVVVPRESKREES